MTTSPTLTRNQLWSAITAKLADLFPHGGINRDAAWFSSDDRQCRTTAKRKNDDGTWTTYEITASDHAGRIEVKVMEGVDNADSFWKPIADSTDRLERVVIGDWCYSITPDSDKPGPGDGFDGRRFEIEWLDADGRPTGETLVTRNLWSRGTIPPAWRTDSLKPNARFVN